MPRHANASLLDTPLGARGGTVGPLMGDPGTLEREVKLSVWPGFALPDLDGIIDGGGVSQGEEQQLDAAYYDTADLRLLRRGVTLRFRRGESPGEVWTAKLPSATPAIGLARREVTLPDRPARCLWRSLIWCGAGRWARR